MGVNSCKVCDDKVALRVIDEELNKGVTYVTTAELMTLRGFKVTAATISQHDKHRVRTMAPAGVVKTKRDLATLVRDKVAAVVEAMPDTAILDKELQPAIKSGLAAQKLLDTREARTDDRKVAVAIAALLAGGSPAGFLAPPELVGEDEPDVIEGVAVEVE